MAELKTEIKKVEKALEKYLQVFASYLGQQNNIFLYVFQTNCL